MITVMTPTYNRAYTLINCYKSLISQTDKRFKWMIIDDGSSDNTEDLVKEWEKESLIDIIYLKKKNGGKASALNLGIEHLDTEYAVCLDSDDVFYDNTVEIAESQLSAIESSDCCGILALRNNPDGSVMGHCPIPQKYQYITAVDIFLYLNLETELICFYKTSILKQYRFPEFEGEKFVSPAWMQYEITQKYKFKTSWERLCQCEYVVDGLTKNKRKVIVKNPKGYSCVKRYSFDLALDYKTRIKHGIMYNYGCILGKDKDWLKNVKHKGWAIALRPLAYCVYFKRKRELRNKA